MTMIETRMRSNLIFTIFAKYLIFDRIHDRFRFRLKNVSAIHDFYISNLCTIPSMPVTNRSSDTDIVATKRKVDDFEKPDFANLGIIIGINQCNTNCVIFSVNHSRSTTNRERQSRVFPSQFEITRVGNLRLIVQYCTFHLYLTTSVSRNINIWSVSVGRLNYSKLFVEEENEGEERQRERYILLSPFRRLSASFRFPAIIWTTLITILYPKFPCISMFNEQRRQALFRETRKH